VRTIDRHPKGPLNAITDVRDVRVAHLTRVGRSSSGRNLRTGLTAVFTRPLRGQQMRPAAVASVGGRVEATGLCVIDDFGFLMTPIVAVNLRSVGRVHDVMVGMRYDMDLGWPPAVVGFNDSRLNDQRTLPFTDEEIAAALGSARAGPVAEGAVGAGAGLVAFGLKSGIGSASRRVAAGGGFHMVGALAALNLGRNDALRVDGASIEAGRTAAPPARQGSAVVIAATDAPLDDRQCRRLATAALAGLARMGATPGQGEGAIAFGVSTGVLLTRNDRSSPAIDLPSSDEAVLAGLTEAVEAAAEEAAIRCLIAVDSEAGTAEYPVMRLAR
jgi:D-aminopeptidase